MANGVTGVMSSLSTVSLVAGVVDKAIGVGHRELDSVGVLSAARVPVGVVGTAMLTGDRGRSVGWLCVGVTGGGVVCRE